ncbi:CaiB/BaiF CoA transferase family protein [Ferrovibrio xuzhouensis]|uniref:CaiB/BaiF CoA transferase family protein n=1 Tax=Ferrovibrio xuzhouensis TaxID=1576914 RepID=A0ABV7VJR7_9PROT
MHAKALERFTVIDLSRIRSGPTAVRQLADWGAKVIKVEAIEEDGMFGTRASSDFQNLHRNKRSLTLNLKDPKAAEIMRRLIEKADVLVENFRPDVKERLGIGYEAARAINPRLVYASISGFGQTGPYAKLPGFDQVAQGMGGLMSVTGLPGQGPVRVGIPIADLGAGLYCALGILTALLEREVSGEGQWVQTSLLQAQVALLDFQATRWLMDKEVPQQAGNDHPTAIPTGVFQTANGYINIAVAGQPMWKKFCKAIDAEHLAEDPRFADSKSRSENRKALNDAIGDKTKGKSSAEWMKIFAVAGVPCGPIYAVDEVFADPQVQHLNLAQPVMHPELGEIHLVGQPIIMSRSKSAIETPTPAKGQHTEEVLLELGYDKAAIEQLKGGGVV